MDNFNKVVGYSIGMFVFCGVMTACDNRSHDNATINVIPSTQIQPAIQESASVPVLTSGSGSGPTPEVKPEQEIPPFKLVGETLQYPKGISESALRVAIPELKCMDYEGKMCNAPTSLYERVLLSGMPMAGSCIIGKEFTAIFKDDALSHFGCDISPVVAENVSNLLTKKYGKSNIDSTTINGMVVDYFEWKSKDDYVVISHYQGNDNNGNTLNNFDIKISSHPSLKKKENWWQVNISSFGGEKEIVSGTTNLICTRVSFTPDQFGINSGMKYKTTELPKVDIVMVVLIMDNDPGPNGKIGTFAFAKSERACHKMYDQLAGYSHKDNSN